MIRFGRELIYRIFDRQFVPHVTVAETHAGLRVSTGKIVSATLEIRGTKKLSRLSLYNTLYRSCGVQKKVQTFLTKKQLVVHTVGSPFFLGSYPASPTLLRVGGKLEVPGNTVAQSVLNASRIIRSLRSLGIYCAVADLEITKVVGN